MKFLLLILMCILFLGFGYDGSDGSDGYTGDYGTSGSSEVIYADGSAMVFDLAGTNGGDGGDASTGSDASNCYQPTDRQDEYGADGGDGGNGGDGGRGGHGGDITVFYKNLSDLKKITVYNSPGMGGDGGRGAGGGDACTCSTYSWNKKYCYQVEDCHNEQRCETRDKCVTRDKCSSREVCSTTDKCRVEQKCHQEKFCVIKNGREVCGTRPKCKSVKTCSPVRSCKQVRTCRPETTCSPVRSCHNERICVPRTQCDTENYSCTNGSDGRFGLDGSYGGSGTRGSIRLVKDITELPKQMTSAEVTFIKAQEGVLLSKQIWEEKNNAKTLFSSKSDIGGSYSHFVKLAQNTITLDWRASQGIEEFANEKLSISFNGKKVSIKFNEELFIKTSLEVAGEQTTLIIHDVFRKPQMIKLDLDIKSIKGFGQDIKMIVTDNEGISEIVDSEVKIYLITNGQSSSEEKIDLGLIKKQDLILKEKSIEIELAKLKLDDHLAKLADGKRVNFEVVVTRKYGENSVSKTFMTPKLELNSDIAIDVLNRTYSESELFDLSILEIKGSDRSLVIKLKDKKRISDIVTTEVKVTLVSKRKFLGSKDLELGSVSSRILKTTESEILIPVGQMDFDGKSKFIEAGRKVRFYLDIKRSFKDKVVNKRMSSKTITLK